MSIAGGAHFGVNVKPFGIIEISFRSGAGAYVITRRAVREVQSVAALPHRRQN